MQDAANTGFTAPHSPAPDRFERERTTRPDRAQASSPLSPAEDTDLFVRALGQFQEIQAATEEPHRLWRTLMTICWVAALLGLVALATFYYARSDNVLAELLDSGKLSAQILPASPAPEGPAAAAWSAAVTSTQPIAAASASAPAVQASGGPGAVAEQPPPFKAEQYKPKLTRSKSLRPRHKLAFRSAFGHVVTTRTYASKAMKRKAQALWDREGKILEPDGSVSIPYKKPAVSEPRPIPGH